GVLGIMFDDYIFTGDFLFSDCIGRIDLLTSSEKDMVNSCVYFLKNISNGFIICPGHGDVEKFGKIKINNLDFD
ncbi:MAG: MBL fold metallo-hydrolase, partial [Oscillospiraceae bacterium]